MIPLERIAAHALGDLDERESLEVDEHVLGCSECALKLERMLMVPDAVRALVGRGAIRVGLTPTTLADMQRAGLVTRTYHLERGGSVACTVDASDLYVLAELEADLAGVTRVDVVKRRGDHRVRMHDMPIDRARGLVAYVLPGDYIRSLASGVDEVTMIAVDEGGDRTLGTYTFNHTAFSGRA
jgi:hypothetical protein